MCDKRKCRPGDNQTGRGETNTAGVISDNYYTPEPPKSQYTKNHKPAKRINASDYSLHAHDFAVLLARIEGDTLHVLGHDLRGRLCRFTFSQPWGVEWSTDHALNITRLAPTDGERGPCVVVDQALSLGGSYFALHLDADGLTVLFNEARGEIMTVEPHDADDWREYRRAMIERGIGLDVTGLYRFGIVKAAVMEAGR